MKRKPLFILLFLLGAGFQGFSQSYIARLWNTKKYSEIIEYSPKGQKLSGPDNVLIGRSYMSLETPQPTDALRHYDIAISKRWQREELYFYRAEANYALGQLNAALADLEVCLQMHPNYQGYLLFKAAIAYEKGDQKLAYDTYYLLCDLYDKQMPFYMLAVISLERENYYKAQEQIDENMLRFERGKDFWTFTAEQQVDLEWRVFKNYEKALNTQEELLSFHNNNAQYLINRLLLLRSENQDSLALLAENDFQERYNSNQIPSSYYKIGNFQVGLYNRDNGIVEDYRFFRPKLNDNTKYARYFISDGGQVLGKYWAGLTGEAKDTNLRYWNFHRDGSDYKVPALDTSYSGFIGLIEAPDSILMPFLPHKMDTIEHSVPVIDGVQNILDSNEFPTTPMEIDSIRSSKAVLPRDSIKN
jgi:tetratricopeptide (TPR) repeat protein